MKDMNIPAVPQGYSTVNSFIITNEASKMITFLEQVFGASEIPETHTLDHDGLILHAELQIGDSIVMVADRKADWPFTPSLLRVYVSDLPATLELAKKHGATIVTEPTDFYGDTLSRFTDPWNNLWWVYEHGEEIDWSAVGSEAGADGLDWSAESKELTYIHKTLINTMKRLGK